MSRIHTTAQWIKIRTFIISHREGVSDVLLDSIRNFLKIVLSMKFYTEKPTKFIENLLKVLDARVEYKKLPYDLRGDDDLTHQDWLEFRDLMGSLYCIVG